MCCVYTSYTEMERCAKIEYFGCQNAETKHQPKRKKKLTYYSDIQLKAG